MNIHEHPRTLNICELLGTYCGPELACFQYSMVDKVDKKEQDDEELKEEDVGAESGPRRPFRPSFR